MSQNLTWQVEQDTLFINGVLTCDTLDRLWDWNQKSNLTITHINVEELIHIDSAGLALLIHLLNENKLKGKEVTLIGRNEKLQSLITLYNLQDVIA